MEQGTTDWLKWRHAGIGASDVPVIMGVSPYKKAHALFEEKIRPEPPANISSFIMEKGNQKEPIARAKMEMILGMSLTPKLIQDETYPFLKMSSDGLNFEHRVSIEVKYVGKNFHTEHCHPKYFPQIQYQHKILGGDWKNYLVEINDSDEIRYKLVDIDLNYCNKMMLEIGRFWKMVLKKEWDIGPILEHQLKKYDELKMASDALEVEIAELKKEIFATTGTKFNYGKYSVITVNKSGSVDYKKIVEEKLPDIDLELFRKSGSSHKEIRIKKEKAEEL